MKQLPRFLTYLGMCRESIEKNLVGESLCLAFAGGSVSDMTAKFALAWFTKWYIEYSTLEKFCDSLPGGNMTIGVIRAEAADESR